ncbi:MAG: isoprenylcysteine carboxylmethyltransferase family protein [Candidatus Nitronauta litoralis]|uniref:Isoprenylcysteine carboxylmethyltransferase family protein n=1 Tax=Candidatus Nitronauta litoralis TaxID=2705533 RepID=A0A7T0BY86_9BACT|nr:MAG: isoprenylcysteine carboxylmethyltransferase family protein [Candidatus Nitronauta litoralis]
MDISSFSAHDLGLFWVWFNFLLYCLVFAFSLYANYNFNTVVVGLIYLVPLVPFGFDPVNLTRVILVSIQNTVFGVIELVIFVLTVKPNDARFDSAHVKQFLGHTLPIAAALIGLSYYARGNIVEVTCYEWWTILIVFLLGSLFRVLAVFQLGRSGFKFDIVFREEQKLMTGQLYSWMRHPSYTAMMVVIFSYALTTHDFLAGSFGLIVAWCGFQYRIYHEEKALKQQFGEEYRLYRGRTGMWFPWRN